MPTNRFAVRVLSLAIASTVIGGGLVGPAFIFAQVMPSQAMPTQTGVVHDDEVYVRSGPNEKDFYATTSLPKGSRVTIVGSRPGWFHIIPPDGSFCYVSKAYIHRIDNSAIGQVAEADVRVRAGSTLNSEHMTILPIRLPQGSTVQIIGETGEFYKIIPPAGTCLYVPQSAIDVVSADRVTPTNIAAVTPAPAPTPAAVAPVATPAPAPVAPAVISTMTPTAPVAVPPAPAETAALSIAPTTEPTTMATEVTATAPTTRPTEVSADARFDELESQFLEASKQPLDQQPIDSLLNKYTRLSTDESLNSSMQKIAAMRVSTLKVRASVRDEYTAAMKMQADAGARRQSLKAEQEELAEKAKQEQITSYTAVGTLRISSLQPSGSTLYRLTDPGTGRTMLYIRSNDGKYAGLLNKFIGVRGEIATDEALSIRTLNPTEAVAVDQTKVGTTIAATEVPASMLGHTATASVPSN